MFTKSGVLTVFVQSYLLRVASPAPRAGKLLLGQPLRNLGRGAGTAPVSRDRLKLKYRCPDYTSLTCVWVREHGDCVLSSTLSREDLTDSPSTAGSCCCTVSSHHSVQWFPGNMGTPDEQSQHCGQMLLHCDQPPQCSAVSRSCWRSCSRRKGTSYVPSVFSRLSIEQSSSGNWNNPEVGEGWDGLLVNSWGLLERAD